MDYKDEEGLTAREYLNPETQVALQDAFEEGRSLDAVVRAYVPQCAVYLKNLPSTEIGAPESDPETAPETAPEADA